MVHQLDVLEKFLTIQLLLKRKCTVTHIDSIITLTGTSDELLYALTQLVNVFSPGYLNINPYEKAEIEAELIGLKPKTINTLGKSLSFFSLGAKWSGQKDGETKTKKKSFSAERRRSSSMSVAEPRRASAPSATDMDIIVQPHNTSPSSPVIKKI